MKKAVLSKLTIEELRKLCPRCKHLKLTRRNYYCRYNNLIKICKHCQEDEAMWELAYKQQNNWIKRYETSKTWKDIKAAIR